MGERDQTQDLGVGIGESERNASILGLQGQIHQWRQRNFPDADDQQQFEGIVEELGELARSRLKRKQGIRGTAREHLINEQDAIGDLLIFLAGYCSYMGWDLINIYYCTAHLVMKRDWIKDPQRGGEQDGDPIPIMSQEEWLEIRGTL